MLLASAKRIQALILEEMALDSRSRAELKEVLLNTAESLHLGALQSTKKAFGERNVQTAKHYGNLGRVYQSLGKCKVHIAGKIRYTNIRGYCYVFVGGFRKRKECI